MTELIQIARVTNAVSILFKKGLKVASYCSSVKVLLHYLL